MHLRILFISFLSCFTYLLHAQTIEDDFEGNMNLLGWVGDDCQIDVNVANPFPQGSNTSAGVMSYDDKGGAFANVRFDASSTFILDANYTFSVKIYLAASSITGSQPNQISLKLQDGNLATPWATQSEIVKPLLLDQWQTITFDFQNDMYINLDAGSLPPTQRRDFNRVVLQINGENNSDHVTAYIDDFYYDGSLPVDPVYDRLVWADECNGDGVIDTSKWFHQTELPLPGSWYNGEIQHYTDRVANSYVEGGIMKIVAQKERFTDQGHTKDYTSARLNSKFAFTYGRVEIRAKLPRGVGTWPAIWMLGKNIDEPGAYWKLQGLGTTPWPACGEIDIMEHWGKNQNFVQSAMHTPSSFGATVNHGGRTIETVSDSFHVYELLWTPEKMRFSVDGIIHYVYEPLVRDGATWPFDSDQYLLLNIAIESLIEPSFTESAMEIDYVRVYQEGGVANDALIEEQAPILYPNPVDDVVSLRFTRVVQEDIQFLIYDMDGQLVRKINKRANGKELIFRNWNVMPKGLYLLEYELDNKKYKVKVLNR